MISLETALYSLRNLNKRKARSFLTILSIFVGIATIFIFISFGYGLYNYVEELSQGASTDKLIIQARGANTIPGLDDTFKLTEDDIEVVERTSGVIEATGVAFKIAEAEYREQKKYVFMIALDPANKMMFEIGDIELESGRLLRPSDNNKVLLGYNYKVPNAIFEKPIVINDKIELNGNELRVVGFLESIGNPQDDAQLYVTSDYFDEIYGKNNYSFGWIIARVGVEDIDRTIEKVEDNLRDFRNQEEGKEDFFVQSFQDMIETYSSALNIVVGFVILIALISVIVSTINTANTMITSVLERYKEIGIMKAVGAKNSEIFGIFLFESGFLGFIAGVIGVLLGWIISLLAGSILASLGWSFLSPYFSYELFIGLILFATITGAISGVIPALTASKTNTVDALRYE